MIENNGQMTNRSLDPYPLCIAPMIQWTDRHWRYFMRLITQRTLLYTEMTMDSALVHNSGIVSLQIVDSNVFEMKYISSCHRQP